MFPLESFRTARCPSEFGVDYAGMDQQGTIEFVVTDKNGCVINLDPATNPSLDEGALPKYLVRAMYWSEPLLIKDAVIVDPAQGLVQVSFGCNDFHKKPGVYLSEFAMYNESCKQLSMFRYLQVSPGLDYTNNGAITIPEIRLVLRDTCPSQNTLLDDFEYTDVEIAYSIRRPIDMWNETTPNVQMHTPSTFPYREHWLICTTGYLLRMAAHKYRRNNLTYNAAGVSVNDQDKFNIYDQVAELRIREFKEWMMRKKMEINIGLGFGTFGSPYRWVY